MLLLLARASTGMQHPGFTVGSCSVSCAAACSVRKGRARAFPDDVVNALEHYGEHAKAAYILFGKYQDSFEQPVAIKGKDMAEPRFVSRSLDACQAAWHA